MAKKVFITAVLVLSFYQNGVCQPEFDKELKSLYKNTVPLIKSERIKVLRSKENLIILDTRSSKEYIISHLPGARFLDYDKFQPENVNKLDKNSKIIVYCSVGYRSERIGEQLIELGFKDVHNLYGGIFEWVNEGNTVVNNEDIATDSVHTYNKDWSRWLQKGVKVY